MMTIDAEDQEDGGVMVEKNQWWEFASHGIFLLTKKTPAFFCCSHIELPWMLFPIAGFNPKKYRNLFPFHFILSKKKNFINGYLIFSCSHSVACFY